MQLLTFDGAGVSGHPNHIAVNAAVELIVAYEAATTPLPLCYTLETVPLWRKFLGCFDIPIAFASDFFAGESYSTQASSLSAHPPPPPRRVLVTHFALPRNVAAMTAHASQFVWFRRLFVAFSRYTFVNTLRLIGHSSHALLNEAAARNDNR